METRHEPVRTHDHRSLGQPIVPLDNALQVFPRRIRLPDRPGSEVQDLVPIVANVGVQSSDAGVSPVATDGSEDVSQGIGSEYQLDTWKLPDRNYSLGDRSIDVGNDHLIVCVPEKDTRRTCRHARVRGSHGKLYSIRARLKIQLFLLWCQRRVLCAL